MAIPKLKTCPLCGGVANAKQVSSGVAGGIFSRSYIIGCSECGLYLKGQAKVLISYLPESGPYCNESELVTLATTWNQRAEGGDSK